MEVRTNKARWAGFGFNRSSDDNSEGASAQPGSGSGGNGEGQEEAKAADHQPVHVRCPKCAAADTYQRGRRHQGRRNSCRTSRTRSRRRHHGTNLKSHNRRGVAGCTPPIRRCWRRYASLIITSGQCSFGSPSFLTLAAYLADVPLARVARATIELSSRGGHKKNREELSCGILATIFWASSTCATPAPRKTRGGPRQVLLILLGRDQQTTVTFKGWDEGVLEQLPLYVQESFPFVLTRKSAIHVDVIADLADNLMHGKGCKASSEALQQANRRLFHANELKCYSMLLWRRWEQLGAGTLDGFGSLGDRDGRADSIRGELLNDFFLIMFFVSCCLSAETTLSLPQDPLLGSSTFSYLCNIDFSSLPN